MNSTQWETLTEFVKWLGREGRCTVDETEKGWFVAHIDRDPETIARQQALAKKDKMEKDDQVFCSAFDIAIEYSHICNARVFIVGAAHGFHREASGERPTCK